jgi:hypothetical protein
LLNGLAWKSIVEGKDGERYLPASLVEHPSVLAWFLIPRALRMGPPSKRAPTARRSSPRTSDKYEAGRTICAEPSETVASPQPAPVNLYENSTRTLFHPGNRPGYGDPIRTASSCPSPAFGGSYQLFQRIDSRLIWPLCPHPRRFTNGQEEVTHFPG